MMAAISAADNGAKVILCEKGNARRSGGIRGGNDHFTCYIPHIHGPEVRERILRNAGMFGGGRSGLTDKIWDLSYEVVKMWEDWGVRMKIDGHYEFTGHEFPGSTGKMGEPGKTTRTWLHFSDLRLSTILEKEARKRDVEILNRVMITEVLKDEEGRAIGAVGVSTREPKLYIIQAGSIIYNTGGVIATRLYASPIVIDYSLAEPETGDGDMMAFRAGAEIQGADMVHRHSAIVFGPYWGQGTWIGVVRDSEGNPIGPPYLQKPEHELGDMSAANAAAHENVRKMGKGPAWFDTRQLTEYDEEYMKFGFESQAMQPFMQWMEAEKLEFRKTRFELGTRQVAVLMKTRIDDNCRTNVEGLYSTFKGGLGNSATSGYIGGRAAAEYARGVESADPETRREKIRDIKKGYEEIMNREGPRFCDWKEAQWAIWQTMHYYSDPPYRTGHTLKAGYNQLCRIRDKARKGLKAGNPHDLYHCLEVLNLFDIGELVLLAVNERKDSRGDSKRIDYPLMNPLLNNKLLVAYQKDGKPAFRWE